MSIHFNFLKTNKDIPVRQEGGGDYPLERLEVGSSMHKVRERLDNAILSNRGQLSTVKRTRTATDHGRVLMGARKGTGVFITHIFLFPLRYLSKQSPQKNQCMCVHFPHPLPKRPPFYWPMGEPCSSRVTEEHVLLCRKNSKKKYDAFWNGSRIGKLFVC